jgi:RHS repeat-associated protein
VVTNDIGTVVGEQRYSPYGETRFTSGTIYTDKLFTGQREITGLGIYHYNARFYSPKIGRFLSPDTIIPGYANPQNLNRFSYVLNNPLKYTDPTGHCVSIDGEHTCGSGNTAPRYDPPKKDKKESKKDKGSSIIDLYILGWENFGSAWSILSNPNATYGQKFGSGAYMGAWGGAHVAGAVGGIILAWEAIVPGAMSCVGNPACQQRVFYSGGDAARIGAEAWAKAHNAVTLKVNTTGMDWLTQARPLVETESLRFAEGASGQVHVFLNLAQYDSGSIWARIEYPALLVNDAVTAIIPHLVDP